jgi:hypothetical protein
MMHVVSHVPPKVPNWPTGWRNAGSLPEAPRDTISSRLGNGDFIHPTMARRFLASVRATKWSAPASLQNSDTGRPARFDVDANRASASAIVSVGEVTCFIG